MFPRAYVIPESVITAFPGSLSYSGVPKATARLQVCYDVKRHQFYELAVQSYRNGRTSAEEIRVAMRDCLSDAGIERIDYVALVDGETLEPVESVSTGTMALIAAYSGPTRLIDNVRIS